MTVLAALLLLAASNAPFFEIGAAQETRAATNRELDVELDPWFALEDKHGTLQGSLRYNPRLLLAEPSSLGTTGVLHRASFEASLNGRGGDRVFVSGSAAYGRTDFSLVSAAASGTLPKLDRIVEVRPLQYMQAGGSVGFARRISRGLRLTGVAAYDQSGGAAPADRASLPRFETARASANLSYDPDRRDSLTLGVSGSLNRVRDSGSRAALVDSSLGWSHVLRRDLGADLRVGMSFVREVGGPFGNRRLLEPALSAGLRGRTTAFGRRLQLALRGNLSPFVDPIDGSVSLRPDVVVQVEYALPRNVALAAGTTLARSAREHRIAGVGYAQVNVRLPLAIGLASGVRWGAQPDTRWAAFLSFTAAHRDLF